MNMRKNKKEKRKKSLEGINKREVSEAIEKSAECTREFINTWHGKFYLGLCKRTRGMS